MTTATKHLCGAVLCGREYSLTATGKIRRHASRTDPEQSCPGSGHPPAASAQEVAQRQDRTAAEWDKALADGERRGEDVEAARASYERALRAWSLPEPVPCPEGMTPDDFEEAASVWLSWQLAERRRGLDRALSFQEIGELRRQRYHAAAQEARIRAAAETAPGADNPMFAKLAKEDSVTQTPPWADASAPEPPELPPPPWLAPPVAEPIEKAQPRPPSAEELFAAPERAARAPRRKRAPLEGMAAELAAQVKEVFYQYQNSRDRSRQTAIGPSEIGVDCDRKLAYRLSGQRRVNFSKDSWAAFVGTQIHRGIEEMFRESDRVGSRYLIDHRVEIHPPLVPSGTLDRADRVLSMVIDDKAPGASALSKMWLDGISEQYRRQLSLYAYAMERSGERFKYIALIGWPRESGNLDNLFVHVEPYDPQIAIDALARLAAIDARLKSGSAPGAEAVMPSRLCEWCDYYLPESADLSLGCRGAG